jgi:hypothetical protein
MSIAAHTDMEPIKNLFGNLSRPTKPTKQTERGQLLETFLSRLNPGRQAKGYPPLTIKRLAYELTAVPTKDLYALLSKIKDGERRGVPVGAIFWSEIRPRKPPTC